MEPWSSLPAPHPGSLRSLRRGLRVSHVCRRPPMFVGLSIGHAASQLFQKAGHTFTAVCTDWCSQTRFSTGGGLRCGHKHGCPHWREQWPFGLAVNVPHLCPLAVPCHLIGASSDEHWSLSCFLPSMPCGLASSYAQVPALVHTVAPHGLHV